MMEKTRVYKGFKVGVFYKDIDWLDKWFKSFFEEIDPCCIADIRKSRNDIRVILKDGTVVMSCRATCSSRGVKVDRAYIDPGLDKDTIHTIIYPAIVTQRIIESFD